MSHDPAELFYLELAVTAFAAHIGVIFALWGRRPRLPVVIKPPTLADALRRAKARRAQQ
jgi:hypothetical protein